MKKKTNGIIDKNLLDALVKVRGMVPTFRDNMSEWPYSRDFGICGNVNYALAHELTHSERNKRMEGMHELMLEWKSRDKSSDYYPVGGYDEFCSEQRTKSLWYNKHRLELLDWLIKVATERVEHEKMEMMT